MESNFIFEEDVKKIVKTFEEGIKKSKDDFQSTVDAELEKFREITGKMTKEELETVEKLIIMRMEDMDKYIKELKYTLPAEVYFDNVKYKREDIGRLVSNFIGKIEVDWSYTRGLYELIKFWKSDDMKISYGAFDSTLRCIGTQLKFKGEAEFSQVLAINEYFNSCNDMYTRDTGILIYLGKMHSVLLDALQIHEKISDSQLIMETEAKHAEEEAKKEPKKKKAKEA